ncbi:MurR/RpiR family transcriptional regulator [Cribrihabitans neustonicus]|uniref:MurR/RpiR family transcriptional regulator n=1 Tax=Cribrihabitans neustonicus TaxID=1429085 RepID=UPI003B5B4A1A
MSGNSGEPAAPATVTAAIERLDEMIGSLPKRLNQCAEFTRRHLHLIAVSTVSDMAKASGVAPSVYMRFCQAIGFSGYSEMQALFRERYTSFRPDYEQRLASLSPEAARNSGQLLAEFAEAGHKSLIGIGNSVANEGLMRVADGLAGARIVHLAGMRRAFAVVSNLAYLLGKLDVPAVLHSDAGHLDSAPLLAPQDALFAVTFAPFSEETIALAKAAHERGVKVFGLTDSEKCPLFEFAAEVLVVREDEVAGFRSLNASITLTTALAVLAGAQRCEP